MGKETPKSSDGDSQSSNVVVGTGGKDSRLTAKLANIRTKLRAKTVFLGAIGVLILATVVYGTIIVKNNIHDGSYVFIVDGKGYSKAEANNLTTYPRERLHMSEDESYKKAYEYLINKAAAQKLGITFSDQEIDDMKKQQTTTIEPGDLDSEWFNLVAWNRLIKTYFLTQKDQKFIQGYSFVFYFGQHIERGFDSAPEGYGDETLIQADREHAQQKAAEFQKALKDKTMTDDQVIQAIKDDPGLSYISNPDKNTFTYSAAFDSVKDQNWQNKLFYREVINFVQTAPVGVSNIRTGQISSVPGEPTKEQIRDGFFYFVDMHHTAGDKTLEEQYNAIKSGLKVRYNG